MNLFSIRPSSWNISNWSNTKIHIIWALSSILASPNKNISKIINRNGNLNSRRKTTTPSRLSNNLKKNLQPSNHQKSSFLMLMLISTIFALDKNGTTIPVPTNIAEKVSSPSNNAKTVDSTLNNPSKDSPSSLNYAIPQAHSTPQLSTKQLKSSWRKRPLKNLHKWLNTKNTYFQPAWPTITTSWNWSQR